MMKNDSERVSCRAGWPRDKKVKELHLHVMGIGRDCRGAGGWVASVLVKSDRQQGTDSMRASKDQPGQGVESHL